MAGYLRYLLGCIYRFQFRACLGSLQFFSMRYRGLGSWGSLVSGLTTEVVDPIHHIIGKQSRHFNQHPFLFFRKVTQ
jgi:hypothetical protein